MASGRAATDVQNDRLFYASPSFNPSLDTDPVSCVIWVYWTDSSSVQAAASGRGGTGTNVAILYEINNKVTCGIGSALSGATNLTSSTWQSWGMSFGGGTDTVHVYLDGISDNSASRTGAARDGELDCYANAIGSNHINDVTSYMQYYDVELTAAHMQEIQYQPFAHAGDLGWMPDMLENGTYRDLSKNQLGNPSTAGGGSFTGSTNGPPVFLLGGQ